MANQFTFIGKIGQIKDSEKFHPIERKTFSSNWTNTTVKFNCISGTNRIMCMTQGGKWSDDSRNSVKTVGNPPAGGGKRPLITIPWDKRFDQDQIDSVAGFRHYIVDLDSSKKRYKLKDLIDAFKNGKDTSELIEVTGCETLEQAKEAYEKSMKRRHVFLSEWDFAEYMAKVVASDKIKGKMFRITGNQDIQYSDAKGVFYSNYHVNRVELVDDETAPSATMDVDFYFGNDCVDKNDGIAYLNGWSKYYDNSVKKFGFMPMSIVMRDDDKKIDGMKRKLSPGESEIANIGIVVDVVDGAPLSAITYDDLDDDTKEDIDMGFVSLEDVLTALGGNKVGERITELRYAKLNARKMKVEDATYNREDMVPARPDVAEDSEDEDLFEDEDL